MAELLRDTRSVVRNWPTELGMCPPLSNFFPTPLDHASPGVAVSRREPGLLGGLTLMSGLFDDAFTRQLVDADGKPVNTWRIDAFTIFPNLDHVQPERLRLHVPTSGSVPA